MGVEVGRIVEAINSAVEQAKAKRRWSFNVLAEQCGLHASTLGHWCKGDTESYKLESLIKLFAYAEMSLDQAFSLQPSTRSVPVIRDGETTATDAATLQRLLEETRKDKRYLQLLVETLRDKEVEPPTSLSDPDMRTLGVFEPLPGDEAVDALEDAIEVARDLAKADDEQADIRDEKEKKA
jgi:transcriptional regulator with XRE-family HTH domain